MTEENVDRRSASYAALTASGAAVLVALVLLVIKVKAAAPAPDIDPGELTRARAQAGAHAAAPPVSPAAPRPDVELGYRRSDGAREVGTAPGGVETAPPAVEPAALGAGPFGRAAQAVNESGEVIGGDAGEAVELYDSGDYENARAKAIQALAANPNDERMLRIATSSSCVLGDADQARVYHARLTPLGQRQLARRCKRYGVEL
jgi:hypothetical protein